MPCKQELNIQLKGLQARMSEAENNITAHYAGISMLCEHLLSTPAAAAGEAMKSIYKLEASGISAMRALVHKVGAIDAKQIMMLGAAKLQDAMQAELEALQVMVVGALQTAIDDAVALAEGTVSAVIAAEDALAAAIEAGISAPIALATASLNSAKAAADAAQSALDSLNNLSAGSSEMLGTQADMAGCVTKSSHITS
jgi:hypothetical protein